MREIKILTLSLRNFKGCETLTLDFGGQSASIYGDNATGKTTIYDALTWLLFGKDSRGRGDFEIKPLGPDNKVKDHAAVTSVEAALLTDGIETRLKRGRRSLRRWISLRENCLSWTTGRSWTANEMI